MLAEHFPSGFQTYPGISALLKQYSCEELVTHITSLVNATLHTLLTYPMECCRKTDGSNFYQDVLEDLITNISRYDKAYELLEDDASRAVFLHLIQFRLIPDTQFIKNAYDVSMQCPVDEGTAEKEQPVHTYIRDLWEIPLFLHAVNPDYKFRLRQQHPEKNRDTVLYVISPATQQEPAQKSIPRTAVALPWMNGWKNVELTKDCGLIPYLLHKNHQMDVTMAGADKGPYPYLEEYVPGLSMEFLETGEEIDKRNYILNHGKEIDLLLLRGAYDVNISIALQYKQINPAGKIYVGLDANSHWMDRILWYRPEFRAFMDSCDVIATSCRAMQKHLNEKWPWKIEYIPNGYYTYGISRPAPDFSKKQNTILTVSRLGTPQKATHVLMNAFALVADRLPDWNLTLIGSIEPAFQQFIDDFFAKHPNLSSRVTFTGVISDKDKLFEEYQKAKIFALPSVFEGGTPNVVSEALTAGCIMAVTKFDAWEDAIDGGNCGMAADINDTEGFAKILCSLCLHPKQERLSQNSYEYAVRNYDMEAIVAKLYELLFGGDLA